MNKPKRGLIGGLKWWWRTRVASWWAVFLPGLREQTNSQRGTFTFARSATPLPAPSDDGITAILTVYNRSQYLSAQIEALRSQSQPPQEIWIWCNDNGKNAEDFSSLADRVIISNSNWKFWGRFTLAAMVRTRYVALFDDDTLPQADWFKSCLQTVASGYNGILGGSGVILPAAGGYSSKHKVGWNGHHYEQTTEVDLVGHAWFFDRAHLQYMWREEPITWENGEDIHFSAMAKKHGGVKTWVPPHPESAENTWSCRPDFGKMASRTGQTATHIGEDHHSLRGSVVDHCRASGWSILAEQNDQ